MEIKLTEMEYNRLLAYQKNIEQLKTEIKIQEQFQKLIIDLACEGHNIEPDLVCRVNDDKKCLIFEDKKEN